MPIFVKPAAGVAITDSGVDAGPYSDNTDAYVLKKTYTIDNTDGKLLDIWLEGEVLASSAASNKGIQINVNEIALVQFYNWPASATRFFWHLSEVAAWTGSPLGGGYTNLAQFPKGSVTVKIYVKGTGGNTTLTNVRMQYGKGP